MELKDTVSMMNSEDYKEKFKTKLEGIDLTMEVA